MDTLTLPHLRQFGKTCEESRRYLHREYHPRFTQSNLVLGILNWIPQHPPISASLLKIPKSVEIGKNQNLKYCELICNSCGKAYKLLIVEENTQ